MRTLLTVLGLGLLAWASSATASPGAEVTTLIPKDTPIVVLVDDPSQLEAHLGELAQAIGAPLPEGDILKMFPFPPPWVRQWDRTRPVALTFRFDTMQAVALIPTKGDSAEALKELDPENDGEIPFVNSSLRVLAKPGYLVASQTNGALRRFREVKEPLQLLDSERKARKDADVFYHVAMEPLRAWIRVGGGLVLGFMGQALQQVPADQLGGQDPEFVLEVYKILFDGIFELADQTELVYGGVGLSAQGVRSDCHMVFVKGSQLQQAFAAIRVSEDDLFEGLPANPFLMAFACGGPQSGEFLKDISVAYINALAENTEILTEEAQKQFLKAAELYTQFSGLAMSMEFAGQDTGIYGLYRYRDPATALRISREMMEASKSLYQQTGPISIEKVAHGKTVAGLQADIYKMIANENAPPESQRMLDAIYGKEPKIVQAVVGDNLGFVMGPRPETIAKLKPGGKQFSQQQAVQKALRLVPGKPFCVMLVDPLGALRTVSSMRDVFPVDPPQFKPPRTSPTPAITAATADQQGVQISLRIPAKTIKAMIETIRTAESQVQEEEFEF